MDLTNKKSQEDLVKMKKEVKKIFFFRICGTGMGAAACLLREAGYDVGGCDYNFYPPMSDYLIKMSIPTCKVEDVTRETLQEYDLIVVGNAVHRKSEHARLIEECGVPFASFPATIGSFVLAQRNVVGISGTHGKTTTTYYLTQILEKLGKKPGYLIGGVIEGRPSSLLGEDYFLIESDEYDSAYFEKFAKFRLYNINNLIVTSLEFDHADIYQNLNQIQDEFKAIFEVVDHSLIYNETYPGICEILKDAVAKTILKYGNLEISPKIIEHNDKGTRFVLEFNEKKIEFTTNLHGDHNILNLTAVILFCLSEGFEVKKVTEAVKNLAQVKRRQEVRGTYKNSLVIDDFAHHPRAISMTLNGLKRRFPGKNIVAVIEPASATGRSDIFQNEFENCFDEVNKVIIATPQIKTSVTWAKQLDVSKLTTALKNKGKDAVSVTSVDELLSEIDQRTSSDNLICVMSNGTCLGLWQSDFVNQLQHA